MTTTSADRVTLILDCLGHDDTELTGQQRLWRHRDGRFVTDDELAAIEKCTVGEIGQAMDLWHEEIEHMQEQDQLRAEFLAITRPYSSGPGDSIRDVVARLPEAEMRRAAEIWQRIGPQYEAWRHDQS